MIRVCKAILLSGAAALAAPFTAVAADIDSAPVESASLDGTLWQTEDGEFVVRLSECSDEELCGDLVWLARPIDKDTGEPKVDDRNPDPAMHDRPVCGLRIVHGLEARGDGRWESGRLYNPDDGNTYSTAVRVEDGGDVISMRAFVAIKALGKTMHLYRLDEPVNLCA